MNIELDNKIKSMPFNEEFERIRLTINHYFGEFICEDKLLSITNMIVYEGKYPKSRGLFDLMNGIRLWLVQLGFDVPFRARYMWIEMNQKTVNCGFVNKPIDEDGRLKDGK